MSSAAINESSMVELVLKGLLGEARDKPLPQFCQKNTTVLFI